jgi:DNA-binding MarR family transcriptional regulator
MPATQASFSPPDGALLRETLIGDMYALVSFLMRRSNLGAFKAIAELDLSFTQIKALCAMDLDEAEPSLKGLAESLGVSLPAASRAIDGLYVRGFVDRYEDPSDRRIKRIRLTDPGRALTSSLNGARMLAMQSFLGSLTDEEARSLSRSLELILREREEIATLRPGHDQMTELLSPSMEVPS